MEHIVITWRELLMVVALFLAIYIAEMLLLMRTGGSPLRKPRWLGLIQEKRVEHALRAEIEALAQRVSSLEKIVAEFHQSADPEMTPYHRAIQMARQGRNADTIAESCGISRGEAELIISMHGSRE